MGHSELDAQEIKKEPFFQSINWIKLEKKEIESPMKPKVQSKDDCTNFDDAFLVEEVVDTPVDSKHIDDPKYEGFTFTRTKME